MSLLRLLTAGKSLIGLKESSRYSISQQRLLPKFTSKKNPFRATTRPDPVQEPLKPARPGTTFELVSPACALKAEGETTSDGCKTAAGMSAINPGSQRPPAETQKRPKIWDIIFGWSSKRQKPALPRFSKPMVQAELSLDSVKVIRNDLSDSDLEVVRAKPAAAQPKSTPSGEPTGEPTVRATEQLTGGVLGAGRT